MYTSEPVAPPLFAPAEFDGRLAALRARMVEQALDGLLVSSPENIFYLTGLEHWGYFAPHLLLVPAAGELVLATRAMERVTIANQVRNARFEGHADTETVANAAQRMLDRTGLAAGRLGWESWAAGLPHGLAQQIQRAAPAARFTDISGLIDDLRLVKSPAEQLLVRRTAHVTDAMAEAAIAAIRPGATEREVAAAATAAMIRAGSTYPGFGPFIRSTARLSEEHTSWGDTQFREGDAVFLELSSSVGHYHAPLGRLVHVGPPPPGTQAMAALAQTAFDAVVAALQPGVEACDVYAAWQGVVDAAGLSHYRRHHCGYQVGIGFPPSWTGGNRVLGLRADSTQRLEAGMTFHILSWLMGTGSGDFFLSNTVLLGEDGAEVLTRTPAEVIRA
jgi:Xaa-Pro dipeptidase